MLSLKKSIYEALPVAIQKKLTKTLCLNPYKKNIVSNAIQDIELNFSRLQKDSIFFIETVNENINEIFNTAKKNSPFWKKRFKNIKQLNLSNLDLLDPIDSSDLRLNFDDLIVDNFKGYLTSTGGTGRNPTKLFLSDKSYYKDIAHFLWSFSKMGYTPDEKKITLRGKNLSSKLTKENPVFNELLVNIFAMNNTNADKLLKDIIKYKPSFGHGYPSAFVRMSKLFPNISEHISLKGIILASENVNLTQKEIIKNAFQCEVISFYGHSERAAFAAQLPGKGEDYFIQPTYGLIEVLDQNNQRVKEGEVGEIVCTGFLNKAMPLFRYKTGDFAEVKHTYQDIPIILNEIIGRWGKDFAINKMGEKISTTSINIHSKEQYNYKFIQLWQTQKGVVKIKIVPWKKEKIINRRLNILKREFEKKLINMEIIIEITDEDSIFKTKSGKVPYFVNCKESGHVS